MPYEDAQQELEAIIRRIESGEIGLEEQLAAYERGVALHRHCQGLLARFEQQFADLSEQLQAPSGGVGQAKPTDGADEGRG
jgi:exodeoxyribonuclease VII small subunit